MSELRLRRETLMNLTPYNVTLGDLAQSSMAHLMDQTMHLEEIYQRALYNDARAGIDALGLDVIVVVPASVIAGL